MNIKVEFKRTNDYDTLQFDFGEHHQCSLSVRSEDATPQTWGESLIVIGQEIIKRHKELNPSK